MLAQLLTIAGALVIGYVHGGRDPAIRGVMELAVAQCNVSTASVEAAKAAAALDRSRVFRSRCTILPSGSH